MLRHILIRPTGAAHGGKLMTYTASELADLYPSDELARLALGQTVQRGDHVHVDLLAFYNRQATPQDRGSIFLRSFMRRPLNQLGEAA